MGGSGLPMHLQLGPQNQPIYFQNMTPDTQNIGNPFNFVNPVLINPQTMQQLYVPQENLNQAINQTYNPNMMTLNMQNQNLNMPGQIQMINTENDMKSMHNSLIYQNTIENAGNNNSMITINQNSLQNYQNYSNSVKFI